MVLWMIGNFERNSRNRVWDFVAVIAVAIVVVTAVCCGGNTLCGRTVSNKFNNISKNAYILGNPGAVLLKMTPKNAGDTNGVER